VAEAALSLVAALRVCHTAASPSEARCDSIPWHSGTHERQKKTEEEEEDRRSGDTGE